MSATHPSNLEDPDAGAPSNVQRRARRWSRLALPLGLCGGLAALCLWTGLAFASFVRDIDTLAAPSAVAADGIVVVTGGSSRIETALALLEDGAAQRLLISGVHNDTDARMLVARTHADQTLFDCCVDLDHAALDTAGNAREAASWARAHAFSSLLVVTSSYHIPRTTREMAHLLPGVELVAFPIEPAVQGQQVSSWPTSLLAREFVKLQLARMRHLVGSAG